MKISKVVKLLIKSIFNAADLDVKRVPLRIGIKIKRRVEVEDNALKELPLVLEDPIEAMHRHRGGKDTAFEGPLDKYVLSNGLSYREEAWSPHYETIIQHANGDINEYKDSSLYHFAQVHNPRNALESIIGFKDGPKSFKNLPPYLYQLYPWTSETAKDKEKSIKQWYHNDALEAGVEGVILKEDGFHSVRWNRGTYRRLIQLYESISKSGYMRSLGHVEVMILRRDDEYRYLVVHGHNRVAVMHAMGYVSIPSICRSPWVVDLKDVAYWPQVRRGIWDKESATAYFNHLFDFDSCSWARSKGLL